MQRLLIRLAAYVAAIALCFGLATAVVFAGPPVLSAPDAARQTAAGETVLLDIRSRQEWAETGVADGAWPVSMHESDFGPRLQAILGQFGPDRVALICATGGRTGYVTEILEQNGIAGVADVSEGMFGNGAAPGWVARGLPVVSVAEAMARYTKATESW